MTGRKSIILLYLGIVFSIVFLIFYSRLPDVDSLPLQVQSNLVSHGTAYVSLHDVPPTLTKAIIDTEDKSFYDNSGISIEGIGRSILTNLKTGDYSEGASTITQQLVRTYYLSSEKTMSRKMKEAALAIKVTRAYTKDEILEMYLNSIYFGHGAWGIDAAAKTYFGKSVKDLNQNQCTILAGLPQAPSYYDLMANLPAARERQQQVLQAMVNQGDIGEGDVSKILSMPLEIKN